MDINNITIKNALEGLKNKDFSSEELTSKYLERIKKIDKELNAFITVDEEGALNQAKKVDELIQSDEDIFEEKKLIGIPFGFKDLYSTKDLKTTAGSKIIDNYIPPYDATATKKLKDAGVVIIGKTNEDAWGHGSSGENSDLGPTRNPYDLTRVPGGSSSGSAAAVAANECLAATGTDTGSSVRLPAAFCNLVGLKPTYGRVSRYGIISMASSFDTIGHITKTVYDNAKILEVTAGRDEFDSTTPDIPVPCYTTALNENQGIKGLRIGISKEYYIEGVDKDVESLTLKAVKHFESMGAVVKNVSLPHTGYAMSCYYILVPAEISSNLARFDGIRFGKTRDQFGNEAKRRIMLGTYVLSSGYYDAYYEKAAKVRTLIKQDFENVFKEVDVLIVPSSPTLPFKIGEKTDDPLQMYLSDIFMCPINIAGIPSLNVPCGFVESLPVGMQIIGPQFSEELLYKVAYKYEQETEYYKIQPKI
ncbi:Asp-tRNA(Asn)/Glu-tRNA(Gln) amidotransferase subunit GatA [Candidatus Parcubacteria bacterium]|nr:MAG: Asp-tRNA(Asn)/Glu-tRNA(Gln) amidotransferase subunit GatA [Candidatus Parcubacteria bacterium]